MLTVYRFYNEAQTHQAEIPAVNGITNARSLARIFASLIGNIDDRKDSRLLQPEILQHATTSNTLPNEIDAILQISFPFGMGFVLYEQDFPITTSITSRTRTPTSTTSQTTTTTTTTSTTSQMTTTTLTTS
ncbi:unnamed protein product [Rotaria sp. Silwood1]|nr:unnamed protein product [Rotaria sp. Silwood1]